MSQLLTQIQDLQNKVKSLSDARELYDPVTASSSGATHVPSQPSTIPSVPGPRLAAILDCPTIHGILLVFQETFLNDYLLEKDELLLSSTIQRIWHLLLHNGDLMLMEIQGHRRLKLDENRKIRRYLYHSSKEVLDIFHTITMVELILTVV